MLHYVTPHLRRMWSEFLLYIPDLEACRVYDLTVCLVLFSVCPGLQAASRFAEQSSWPVWSDWTGVWESLHRKPWMWVTDSVRVSVHLLSGRFQCLNTDTSSLCLRCSTSGNWITEWAADWRWTGCRGRRPHQGSLKNKRSVISNTNLFKSVIYTEYS